MFRLLIVDDEPIIVQGLHDLFKDLANELKLDVYCANSGLEAISWMQRVKIDIVLTDIQMPGMNGLELQQVIEQDWPHCKVIFLTGYNEFDFVQQALRQGGVDYVLKTEDDRQVVKAVQKACQSITEKFEAEKLILKAKDNIRTALPYLQTEYLSHLLFDTQHDIQPSKHRFDELQLPLKVDQSLLMAVGRVDQWQDIRPREKSLLLFAIHNIAEEYLMPKINIVHVTYQYERWVWLLQPNREDQKDWTNVIKYVQGCLESVQMQVRNLLRLTCSFVMVSKPFVWEQLSKKFDLLKWKLNLGLGMGEEMLLTEEDVLDVNMERQQTVNYKARISQLEIFLESGQRQQFYRLFNELTQDVSAQPIQAYDTIYEIYYSLVVMFLACINRWNMLARISAEVNISKLTKIEEHASWAEMSDYFITITNLFFAYREQEFQVNTNMIIRQIDDYILRNLGGDLSQIKLAEVVYLSPSYLSRLYKQEKGISLSDHITALRIETAKKLLRDNKLKIHEVAASVGFDSASYFARFFKRYANMTPVQFREQILGELAR